MSKQQTQDWFYCLKESQSVSESKKSESITSFNIKNIQLDAFSSDNK